jgi:hypothetical protein
VGATVFVAATLAGSLEELLTGFKRGITNGHSLAKTIGATSVAVMGRNARNILLYGAGYTYHTTPLHEDAGIAYLAALAPETARAGMRYTLTQKEMEAKESKSPARRPVLFKEVV